MPRPLPDELLEEVLRRLLPHEPADLVRAALVSRRWCRLISDPGFRRRFREFHRCPPMLGMLCNIYDPIDTVRFIPTAAFGTPRTDFHDTRVLDARHGRVLCAKISCSVRTFTVWDPITNEVRELPFPEKWLYMSWWTAAILCSTGGCDHLDCHQGPFLIVFACINKYDNAVVYTYSSDAGAWSEPAIGQDYICTSEMGKALVGDALYFGYYNQTRNTTLKYNFELRQMSMIQLPSSLSVMSLMRSRFTITEDGGLGLVIIDDSKLYMWSRMDTHEVDAIWEKRVIIDLNTVFPVDVDVTELGMIGSGVGIIIFTGMNDKVYTIDLKTYKVKKVYEGTAHTMFPYMSFYTPALKVCSVEEQGAGGSSA